MMMWLLLLALNGGVAAWNGVTYSHTHHLPNAVLVTISTLYALFCLARAVQQR